MDIKLQLTIKTLKTTCTVLIMLHIMEQHLDWDLQSTVPAGFHMKDLTKKLIYMKILQTGIEMNLPLVKIVPPGQTSLKTGSFGQNKRI